MKSKLGKLLGDPEAMEKLVARYEAAVELNKQSLNDLTKGRALAEALADWERQIAQAQEYLASVNKEAQEMSEAANVFLDEAKQRMGDAEALKQKHEQGVAKVEAMNQEAQALLSDMNARRVALQDEIQTHKDEVAKLAAWVGSLKTVLQSMPASKG